MINNEIKAKEVNLVNTDTKGITRMSTDDAIRLADEQGLDLICVNEKGDIPVVKIGDYKKFLYDKQKKEKENKKKARLNSQETKEIQISDVIAEHDLEIKAKNADRIIKEGNKVRLVIRYRGRSIRLIEQGPNKLRNLVTKMQSNFKIDAEPKIEGNRVIMLVSPMETRK